MGLSPRTRLGPYEVIAPLGAGGMGEVYRAKDTRLDRIVAIKVLPAHVSQDPERKARFEREAKTVASLNHPHICVLHDVGHQDGIDFLVMEYLEGETLAERVAKGPLPIDQVLRFGTEIADALARAHRAHIVHRDLKPANVLLTKAGAKLLDFGLAKAGAPLVPAPSTESHSPTATRGLTAEGTLLGTFQYMSPEQLEGREADHRADIWALGCVLYEMATGRRAFEGKSQASLISAIMSSDPQPIAQRQAMTPPALDRLVRACLAKDPDERMQSAHDVARELGWMRDSDEPTTIRQVRSRLTRVLLGPLAGLVVGGLVATITVLKVGRGGPAGASSIKHLALSLPSTVELVAHDKQGLAISPDGKHVVFPGRQGGVTQLYDRPIDRLDALPIPGTEGAAQPFFSPNGRWVGFFAGGKLKKVALAGGTPVAICDVKDANGASWGSDDVILWGFGGLFRVAAAGGSPERVTTPDPSQDVADHEGPDLLPGGQAVLFTIWTGGYAHPKIAVQSLKTGQRRVLLDGIHARFAATGHIVFFRAGSLWAAPFDGDRLEVTGEPVPVVQGVHAEWSVWPYFSLSAEGTLLYVPGAPLDAKRLVWVDRKGAVQPLDAPPKPYDNPVLSPDGQRLAVVIREDNQDVWTYEPAHGTLTRLTSDPGEDETPVWTQDGKRVVFAGNRSGASQLLWANADGSGAEEVLLGTRGGHRHADSISPDNQVLAFEEEPATGSDIWLMPFRGDRKPRLLQRASGAKFSPDGRWIAYRSDQSGRAEVYVQAYPGPGGRRQISTEGGVEPVWARSGRELFYRNGVKMMVAEIATQPVFSADRPRVLFEGRFDTLPWNANYDVTADGQRFLMVQSVETTGQEQISVVLNWFEELKRLVPATRR